MKPYELILREKVDKEVIETEDEVMEELGSKYEEKEELDDDEIDLDKFEIARDSIGAKYMEMEKSVFFFFGKCNIYTGGSSVGAQKT